MKHCKLFFINNRSRKKGKKEEKHKMVRKIRKRGYFGNPTLLQRAVPPATRFVFISYRVSLLSPISCAFCLLFLHGNRSALERETKLLEREKNLERERERRWKRPLSSEQPQQPWRRRLPPKPPPTPFLPQPEKRASSLLPPMTMAM